MTASQSNSDTEIERPRLTGLALLHAELWILKALGVPDLFAGITSPTVRIGRLRAHILGHGLADAKVNSAATLSWREAFERFAHEPLGEGM